MQSLSFTRNTAGNRETMAAFQTSVTGSLTEIVISEGSAIQPLQLLPILAQCNANQRWLMWLSPNRKINKHWLEKVGLQNTPVVHIDLREETQHELSLKILAAGNSHMVMEWQGNLSETQRNTIKQCAVESASQVILLRRN